MTIPVVRQRAHAPKTRTGCRTCRARHVKCDEVKPTCARCNKSGRICLGYSSARSPQDVRQVFLQPKEKEEPPAEAAILCSPSGMQLAMTTAESQAFDFFRRQTVHQLPGNAWLLSWERLALHASYQEPAILHAVIALGSLHQSYGKLESSWNPGSPIDQLSLPFATDQCNKAMVHASKHIASLSADGSDSAVEAVMLLSLLLFCFEVWCGQDVRASFHLRTGLRILYDRVREREGTETYDGKRLVVMRVNPCNNLDILLQTFVRLDYDLTIQGRTEDFLHPVVRADIPSFFFSLDNAMVYLDVLSASIQDVGRELLELALPSLRDELPPDIDEETLTHLAAVHARRVSLASNPKLAERVKASKQDVTRWLNAFACIPITPERECAHVLAQIQAFALWHQVCTWRQANEMLEDRFEEQFEYSLGLAERYVDLYRHDIDQDQPKTRPAFSLGTRLVPCLFMIVCKCRKSSIRRRGIKLIRSINLQGVFDSYCISAFAQKIVDLEENCARRILGIDDDDDLEAYQVPQGARLLEVNMTNWSKTEFYKCSTGRMIYAFKGTKGDIQIGFKSYSIDRPTVKSK